MICPTEGSFMQFLVMSRRKLESFPQDAFSELFDDEVAKARQFYGDGFTRQIWHRADNSGVCQIVEAASESEVREKLETLPFYRAGMLEIDVIGLKPYSGFGT